MFGIFYLLFNGTMSTIAKAKRSYDYCKARDEAHKKGRLTYNGFNGKRLVSNDKSVYITTRNGDKVLADLYTGEVYKNYTEEERKEKEMLAESRGETVILVGYNEMQEYNRNKAKTILINPDYRDTKTRKYYVTAIVNGLIFYMDIESGHLIRLADNQDINKKWGKLSVEEIIRIVNERQDVLIKEPNYSHDFGWWKSKFYLKKTGNDIFMVDDDGTIVEGSLFDDDIKQIRNKLLKEKTV